MFGIGPMEMGIIAVVALLIFGPEKLPEMMGQAGKMVRDFRNMTSEMTGEFEKTVAEAKGIGKELNKELGSMSKQVSSVTNSVQKDLNGKKTTKTAKSSTSSKKSTSSSKKSDTAASTRRPAAARAKPASTSTDSASASSTSTNGSATSKSTGTTTKPKAVPAPQASREDPIASFSLFEPDAPKRQRRARTATMSAFGDATPRTALLDEPDTTASDDVIAAQDANDPLVRARQRRRSAGYARHSA